VALRQLVVHISLSLNPEDKQRIPEYEDRAVHDQKNFSATASALVVKDHEFSRPSIRRFGA
jgi:hypothetical protein